jgi:hypothetical protein
VRGPHEAAPADRISPRRSVCVLKHSGSVIGGILRFQALKKRGRVFQTYREAKSWDTDGDRQWMVANARDTPFLKPQSGF